MTWYVRINGKLVGTVIAVSETAAYLLAMGKFWPGLSDRIEVVPRKL
jgi:hypothetical protein